MNVPFVDLPLQYQNLRAEIDPAVLAVFAKCNFILGQEVQEFEKEFADFIGAKHCVSVGSGTDALQLILRAIGIGPGHEVITAANTFIATVEAITYVGATPVLVDCTRGDYLIDPEGVARAITPRTKAVIPVHLYGQPANIDPLADLGARHGFPIVEDAAQAHGATWRDGRRCGNVGLAAGFSFYPGKNLGAYGDAGAITTNDSELAERLKLLRNWGSVVKYEHEIKGYNSRLDTVQAAVLRVKLCYLERWNDARLGLARGYLARLVGVPGIVLPKEASWNGRHVYHLFVIRLPGQDRDSVMRKLGERGIQTGIHYPKPVHLQNAYSDLGLGLGSFPNAEAMAGELLSLPMFPEMTEQQLDHVAGSLKEIVAG
jgi:dTDP-4-amino-4,6-dideoxygalactose transaminase